MGRLQWVDFRLLHDVAPRENTVKSLQEALTAAGPEGCFSTDSFAALIIPDRQQTCIHKDVSHQGQASSRTLGCARSRETLRLWNGKNSVVFLWPF